MRIAPVVLAAVLLVAGVAQATLLVEDPAGDVQLMFTTGETAPAPEGTRDLIDLRALSIDETPETIVLTLGVNGFRDGQELDGGFLQAGFTFGAMEYLVGLTVSGDQPVYTMEERAGLARRSEGDTDWQGVSELNLEIQASAAAFAVTIPRAVLQNEVGRLPRAGDQLTRFWAMSYDRMTSSSIVSAAGPGLLVTTADATDELQAAGEYVFTQDPPTSKLIEITSAEPIRSSNGEQGTTVFAVFVTNHGGAPRDVSIALDRVPEAWQVTSTRLGVHLAGGAAVGLHVVVAIPFNHAHGEVVTFDLRVLDADSLDPLDSMAIGLKFLDVPQPAGHHDTVWLHARSAAIGDVAFLGGTVRSGPFLSTVADDNRSSGGPLSYTALDNAQLTTKFTWCIPLSPRLLIGLDATRAEPGSWQVGLGTGLAVKGRLDGRIFVATPAENQGADASLCTPGNALVPIGRAPSFAIDLPADSTQTVEGEWTHDPRVVPYAANQDLLLEVTLTLDQPVVTRMADAPRILPGGSIELPLLEYHEEAPVVSDGEAIALRLDGPSRKVRNPGDVATFNFTLLGDGTFDVEVIGLNHEWAALSSSRVAGNAPFVLEVRVPDDASAGQLSDLIVKATRRDSWDLTLARVVVEVDSATDHPNDQVSRPEKASTPGFGILATMLGFLIVMRRSRG